MDPVFDHSSVPDLLKDVWWEIEALNESFIPLLLDGERGVVVYEEIADACARTPGQDPTEVCIVWLGDDAWQAATEQARIDTVEEMTVLIEHVREQRFLSVAHAGRPLAQTLHGPRAVG